MKHITRVKLEIKRRSVAYRKEQERKHRAAVDAVALIVSSSIPRDPPILYKGRADAVVVVNGKAIPVNIK